MKRNIFMTSVLRRPLVTLLLLVFIGTVAFAFISRAAEFLVVERETERIGGHYRTIGALTPLDPQQTEVSGGAALVEQSAYVAFADRQRFCSGVLNGLNNADVDGYSSDYEGRQYATGLTVSDVWFYGRLVHKEYAENISHMPSYDTADLQGYYLAFEIDKVEAGYPEYVEEGETARLLFLLRDGASENSVEEGMIEGKRYFVKASFNPGFNAASWTNARNSLMMKPLNGELWFVQMEPGETVDFNDPSLSGVEEAIALQRENQSALFVYATRDMSSMPSIRPENKLYYLAEGRWLDRDDDVAARRVCVVHNEFASIRHLSIGDKITLNLRDLRSSEIYGYIVTDEDKANWRAYPAEQAEFEIVGLYGMLLGSLQPTSRNLAMFIPDSCMPSSYYFENDRPLTSDMFSFVLHSSKDKRAFLEEQEEALMALGFGVSFVENNADAYWASVLPLQQSTAVNAAVFAGVLALALALATFLYIYQRRRDFAIQRALGISRRKAAFQLAVPMAFMGLIAVGAGGALSWQVTLGKAMDTLAVVQGPEGVETSAQMPALWLALLCGGIFLLLMLFLAFGIWRMAARPVLALLQGGNAAVAQKGSKKKTVERAKREVTAAAAERAQPQMHEVAPALVTGEGNAATGAPSASKRFSASVRYVLRHMRRSWVRSIAVAAVAMCFMLALGWLNRTIAMNKAEIDRQYAAIRVETEIVKLTPSSSTTNGGFIFDDTVHAILDSGYMEESYLEALAPRDFLAPLAAENQESRYPWDDTRRTARFFLCGVEDSGAFFAAAGQHAEVEYAKGYDNSIFSEKWTPERIKAGAKAEIVLPEKMIERLGIDLGDIVFMVDARGGSSLQQCIVAGKYSGTITVPEVHEDVVLVPLSALAAAEDLAIQRLCYSVARFTIDPAKNRELHGFTEEMKALVAAPKAGLLKLNYVVWDDELRQVVEPLEKNLRLMEVLYPVTLAVSVLISMGVALLMVLQTAREAAIMRVLGMGRARARAMLSAEQLLLSLIGVVLGLAVLAFTDREAFLSLINAYIFCAALYFAGAILGAAFGAISVTNRPPLALLQVKE